MLKNKKVCCLGAGFVGLPTSSVLATHNPQSKFVVYDVDIKRVQMCNKGIMPIYEPKLEETLNAVLNKNLFFTADIKVALENASVIFIAVPTPTKLFGLEKGKGYDLSYTEKAIRSIVMFYNNSEIKDQVIIVQKSTVPVGTAEVITDIINNVSIPQNRLKYVVTSNPQFLAEGSAIDDFNNPERVVIGSKSGSNIQDLLALYHYVDPTHIILTNRFSSELSKLTSNCFLAQRVSSINSISLLCEEVGADVKQIKKCIENDSRIGGKFLNSSVGWGGSCFRKDILALIYLAQCKGLPQVASYWNAVITMNDYRQVKFFNRIFQVMNHNLLGKKIAIFGVAFKKDTCDARDSPSLKVCHHLLSEGATLSIFDPKTTLVSFIRQMEYNHYWNESFNKKVTETTSPSEAVEKSHGIVLLTEWDIFQTCDYKTFFSTMEKPAYLFDGRNILPEQELVDIGFRYYRIGKKPQPLF